MFELLCKDCNMIVNFNEMNANDIVRKLSIVEKKPNAVWEALEKHYGFGFLNKMVEL